jgi:predicted Zn-dependent protease
MPKPTDRTHWHHLYRLAFLGVLGLGSGCSRAPFTNRIQLNLVPDPLMVGLGASAYGDMLGQVEVDKTSTDAKTLKRVGKRVARVARRPSYRWRYALIDDEDTLNAWCLPGGKIAFYKGILPVLENEAGMGFVMGHEIGHAMAHHSAERLSQQATVLGGLTAMYLYMDNKTSLPDEAKQMLLAALGIGIEVGVLLPFSRKHESEADVAGLMYMSRAGYPPEESIDVWTRMGKAAGRSEMPTFLSTHPSHKQRKKNLREWMPSAKKRHDRNKLSADTQITLWTSKG